MLLFFCQPRENAFRTKPPSYPVAGRFWGDLNDYQTSSHYPTKTSGRVQPCSFLEERAFAGVQPAFQAQPPPKPELSGPHSRGTFRYIPFLPFERQFRAAFIVPAFFAEFLEEREITGIANPVDLFSFHIDQVLSFIPF